MLDHTYCYTPAVAHLRGLVRGGELGDLQYLDSVRINLGLVQRDVDVLWDLAPHDLSIFDSILPDDVAPVAVSAHGSDPIGAGHACVAHLTIQLSNGAMAHVHVNWLSPTKIRTLVVGGSRRTVVWDDLNPSQRLSVYDRGVDTAIPQRRGLAARERATVSYRIGDMVAPALPEKRGAAGGDGGVRGVDHATPCPAHRRPRRPPRARPAGIRRGEHGGGRRVRPGPRRPRTYRSRSRWSCLVTPAEFEGSVMSRTEPAP